MMNRCLILYSTTDGHTKKICDYIASNLDEVNKISVVNITSFNQKDLDNYDSIIIGASIRYGKHQNSLYKFINKNREKLDAKKNAFFTVNVVARKTEKNLPQTNPYMIKFLKLTKWKPQHLNVFAGRINYPKYGFIDKYVIRFIMWLSKGPTDTRGDFEFTDWDKVKSFAKTF